ncbi:DNA-directed DNA polymerase [Malassezia cuniculi]|uniref:DNA-directed DNA polymerase n=1 Tax=Malassezia cuniculi TaxID=948313 RepID=A0AAF0F0K6_9BASI|nr:DNA-directed DNA polymerase [Malassezia cuniculi]
MAGTLALFWGLAAVEKDARLGASDALVDELVRQSSQIDSGEPFVPEHGSVSVETDEAEVVEAEQRIDALSADTSYSLRRLVRGLASPRENARTGFAVALTELLSHLPSVSSHDVLVLLLKHTVTRGNLSGQEVRDLQFARIFGIYALIRSGIVYSRGSLAVYQRLFNVLLAVASNKSWISESCGWVLTELINGLESAPAWRSEALAWTADCVVANAELSPEKLALIIVLLRHPELRVTERFSPLKSPSLFATSNLTLLGSALREGAPIHLSDAPPPKPGSWNAKLPFVWDMVFDVYFGADDAARTGAAPFADMFRIMVDENLFATNASSERKSWGFQVLHLALQRAPADVLPFLFTPNLMRTWVNHLSNKDRLLHSMATKTVTVVSDAVKRNPTAGVALVTQLLGEQGRQNFDRITHTKTIESILASLDESGVQQYLAYLRGIAYSPAASDDQKHIASQRQWVCDQMLALVRSNLMPKSQGWIQEIIVFLLGFGYFDIVTPPPAPWQHVLQKPAVAFDENIQTVCRARFLSCLSELKGEVDGKPWVVHAYETLNKMGKNKAFKRLAEPVNRERMEAGATLLRSLKKAAAKASEADRVRIHAFENLLAAVIFVAHEDEEDAPDMIEPLVDAAQLLFFNKAAEDVQPIEVLVDSLVDLLEVSSAFLRGIVCSVFAQFSGEVNEHAISRIVDQLGIAEDIEGDEEQMEEDEEVQDEEEDEEEEEEEEEEIEESEEEGEDSDDEEANDDEVDPILRSKVEEAMRAIGAADDSDEDDALDDEQMISLDDKLADIFRQHSSSRRKDREAEKRDTAMFQNKVLDLLEIYAKEQSGNPLIMRIVEPLFALAKGPGDTSPQVANRAGQIIRARICKGKEQVRGGFDVQRAYESLATLHKFARSGNHSSLADLTSALSQFYTKVLLRSENADVAAVAAVYSETLSDFLRRKASPVRPAFLLDAIRRFPELGWALRDELLDGSRVSAAARAFRQVQALHMLQAVLQQQQQENTRQASADQVLAFVADVRSAIVEIVQTAARSDDSQLNAQRLKEVLRFALQAVRIGARISQEASADALVEALPPSAFASLSEDLSSSERFKNSTSLLGMLKEAQSIITRAAAAEPSRKRTAPSTGRKSKKAKSDSDA